MKSSRVGIAGLLHESNTFLPVLTRLIHFEQGSLTQGDALLKRWSGIRPELGGFLEGARVHGFQPVPLMATFAVPSGTIESETWLRCLGSTWQRHDS